MPPRTCPTLLPLRMTAPIARRPGKSLPRGIVSVIQTPFDEHLRLDLEALSRLVDDAIEAGADGFLVPALASEGAYLSDPERDAILSLVSSRAQSRIPIICAVSADTPEACGKHARAASGFNPAAFLVAVPQSLYGQTSGLRSFFTAVDGLMPGQWIIQDYQVGGEGLAVSDIVEFQRRCTRLVGIKIETLPAGPKYSAVRRACGEDFWIAGGWAISQMIEALDRGVDAMVPECAMIRTYKAIEGLHRSQRRMEAISVFQRLLPVLAFSNQDLATSVAFFKRLLVRKRIFASANQRMPLIGWDDVSESTARELIDQYLALERACSETAAVLADQASD